VANNIRKGKVLIRAAPFVVERALDQGNRGYPTEQGQRRRYLLCTAS
jgi:hypothetical protein